MASLRFILMSKVRCSRCGRRVKKLVPVTIITGSEYLWCERCEGEIIDFHESLGSGGFGMSADEVRSLKARGDRMIRGWQVDRAIDKIRRGW